MLEALALALVVGVAGQEHVDEEDGPSSFM